MVVSHNIEFHGKDIWYNHPISKLYLTSDFSEDNWYEFFLLNTSEDDFNHKFNNIVNLKILDLKKYFIYENEILGFYIPISLSNDINNIIGEKIFLKNSFALKDDKFFINFIDAGDLIYYIRHTIKYNDENNQNILKNIKANYENFDTSDSKIFIKVFPYDNCGNIDFNSKNKAREYLNFYINGG